MKKSRSIILFIILAYIHANTIQEIIITGNNLTKDSTILNLISHSIGDSINTKQAIEDQAALFNSELFYDAIIYPDSSKYYIFVWEKPAIFSRPEVDKHDILGWSYGGSVLFNNLFPILLSAVSSVHSHVMIINGIPFSLARLNMIFLSFCLRQAQALTILLSL